PVRRPVDGERRDVLPAVRVAVRRGAPRVHGADVPDLLPRRRVLHESLLMAMSQVAPFGPDVVLVGDQLEWAEARAALARLMERYHRVPPARGLR
ncbi:MAG: hypothetical protein M0Z49_11640, partial [Chloroflexi bacterium]|nr:hypothetical protein [Chloroflexota bacterium]